VCDGEHATSGIRDHCAASARKSHSRFAPLGESNSSRSYDATTPRVVLPCESWQQDAVR
jgi:hypothetical protein